jgi:hypothetical protein
VVQFFCPVPRTQWVLDVYYYLISFNVRECWMYIVTITGIIQSNQSCFLGIRCGGSDFFFFEF